VTIIPGGSWTAGFSVCVTTCDPDKVTAQIMKWDSRQKVWRGIQTLTVGANSWFYDIDASSIRNVWAVGAYQEPGGPLRTFILRGGNG
jgi:hypothetical protein